jgi:hypothetical protein
MSMATIAVMMGWLLPALIETAKVTGGVLAVAGALMAYPRTRRVLAATWVFSKRHGPKWLLPAMGAGQFIPGQLDEVIIAAIALAVMLRTSGRRRLFRRYVSYAWSRPRPAVSVTAPVSAVSGGSSPLPAFAPSAAPRVAR